MLTIFRKIRLRLINQVTSDTAKKSIIDSLPGHKTPDEHAEGSARKYLLYAIGEVLLVMIGILLALQVNNWNEARNDRLRLNNHYKELRNDLINDKKNIEELIVNVRKINNRTFTLSQFINTEGTKADSAILTQSLLEAEPYSFFSMNNAAYSNLVSTGDIKFIKNVELKNLLSIYYNNTNWNWTGHNGNLKDVIEQYSSYIHKFLPPLVSRDFYIQTFSEYLSDGSFDSYHSSKNQEVDWGKLKNDKEFSQIIS